MSVLFSDLLFVIEPNLIILTKAMGKLYVNQLRSGHIRAYYCIKCDTDLALESDYVFTDFLGIQRGEALLFKKVVNVYFGLQEEKLMTSGFYKGAQVYCKVCCMQIGWTYFETDDAQCKFKEGRTSLEVKSINLQRQSRLGFP